VFITLSKGYCHCHRLFNSRRRLSNFLDTRRMTHTGGGSGGALGRFLSMKQEDKHPVYLTGETDGNHAD